MAAVMEAPKAPAKDVSKERVMLFSTKPRYYLQLEATKRGLIKLSNGSFEPQQMGQHRHIQFNLHRATHWQDAEGTEYPLTVADMAIIRKRHMYGTDFAEAVAPDNDPKSMNLAFMKKKLPAQFQGFCREATRRDEETTRLGIIQQWEIEKDVEAVQNGEYKFPE